MSEKNELFEQVEIVLDKLRPYLQADGGDISLVDITADNVVKVKLEGACHNCPMRIQTLKSGIEQAIKSEIPAIKSVEAAD